MPCVSKKSLRFEELGLGVFKKSKNSGHFLAFVCTVLSLSDLAIKITDSSLSKLAASVVLHVLQKIVSLLPPPHKQTLSPLEQSSLPTVESNR